MTLEAFAALFRGRDPHARLEAHYKGGQVMLSANGEVLLTLPCEETPPFDLFAGMRVLVYGLREEPVTARVEEMRHREDSAPHETWKNAAATRSALLSYSVRPALESDGQELVFTALEIGGKWWSAQFNRLTFERIGPV